MNDNEEPIYDFAPLKSFLERKGYQVGTRQAYEPFKPEDVKAEDVTNGSMEFRTDGIFVLGANGQERQVFLYKKDYRMMQYGKPRFHICKCKVIDDFITSGSFRDHYVRANSEPVPVIDIDDNWMEKEVTGLPLCGYCKKIIAGYGNIDTTKFVEMLKASNGDNHEDENLELDLFGYVKDWETISRQFREKHEYTCENCGLKIEDDYDKQYMHVHHLNGDKLNNKESNLKCLCLYCHAHVDEHHYKRLTTGANKYSYISFVDRYGDDGLWQIEDDELTKIHHLAKQMYEGKTIINVNIHNHYHGEIDNLTINK